MYTNIPRRPKAGPTVAGIIGLVVVAVVVSALIYAWAGMVLLGIFGVHVGYGTCLGVAFLVNILLGAVRGVSLGG